MLIWQVNENLCVVYLLTRDSLVLWASMSLPESQYNLLRSLNPGIFSDIWLFVTSSLKNEILQFLHKLQSNQLVQRGDMQDKYQLESFF